jgi:hypothetical protein
MLRNSERSTLKTCEFQWYISYLRQLRTGTPMPALRFGTLIHIALAAYYRPGIKRGPHPAKTFVKVYAADLAENETRFGQRVGDDEAWVDAEELGVAMLNNYIDEYGADDDWEILHTEHPFQVVVNRPENTYGGDWQGGDPWFIYTGVLDLVARKLSTGELWIWDHKTTKAIGQQLKYLQMDDQAGGYWSFGVQSLINKGILKPGEKLAGMYYNFLRKAMPDERQSKVLKGTRVYLNLDGSVSKKQPPKYFDRMQIYRDEPDRAMAYSRALNDYRRKEMLVNGELEVTKHTGQFTCPSCPARDICELHETGQDWEGFIADTTYLWEPYAEHEVYTAETK